jgi:uncharacterized membrane protein YqiK
MIYVTIDKRGPGSMFLPCGNVPAGSHILVPGENEVCDEHLPELEAAAKMQDPRFFVISKKKPGGEPATAPKAKAPGSDEPASSLEAAVSAAQLYDEIGQEMAVAKSSDRRSPMYIVQRVSIEEYEADVVRRAEAAEAEAAKPKSKADLAKEEKAAKAEAEAKEKADRVAEAERKKAEAISEAGKAAPEPEKTPNKLTTESLKGKEAK